MSATDESVIGGTLTYFYVRVPEGQNVDWRVRHADETVQIAGGFFVPCIKGVYTPQEDGTYEVRALSPSNTDLVRRMLAEHEGLSIEREEQVPRGLHNLLVAEPVD